MIDEGRSPDTASATDMPVGRADDVAELRRRLRGMRLVTITGSPGAGKSRLATAVATLESAGGSRPATTVDLAAIAAERMDAAALTAVFADVEAAIAADTAAAARDARDRILLLDNCDRVLAAGGPLLLGLLGRLPSLRVLTTSREPWRLPGEVVYRIAGLTTSPAARHDAARLFAEHCAAASRGIEPGPDAAGDVAWICDRLDGLPLLLALAGRLAATHTVGQIRAELGKGFDILDTGPGMGTDHRHRGWSAAVDWSYASLSVAEQALLRRLSVLPKNFSRDSAAMVGADEHAPAAAVPARLVSLEAKSLINAEVRTEAASARFSMPTAIQHFAHRMLRHAAELDEVMNRLADNLMAWTGRHGPHHVIGIGDRRRLSVERDTIRKVLTWLPAGDGRGLFLAAVLAVAGTTAEQRRADRVEVLRVIDAAHPTTAHRAVAVAGALSLSCWYGSRQRALELAHEAVSLIRRTDPESHLAQALLNAALARERYGWVDAGRADAQAALEIGRRLGSEPIVALASAHLARHLLREGGVAAADAAMSAALPEARAIASPEHLGLILNTAGAVALAEGDPGSAEQRFSERLGFAFSNPVGAHDSVIGLALAAYRTGDLERFLQLTALAEDDELAATRLGLFPHWTAELAQAHDDVAREMPAGRASAATRFGQGLGLHRSVTLALGEDAAGAWAAPGAESLSPREWEVIQWVMRGLGNQQIAQRMNLSVRTVESHIRNIRTVVGLRSRAHMAAWAARHSSVPLV
ncbi:ATP-binding protein [Mangrovihabitans endophyticus]|uniref:HTH luxR-type domain-containing protein n=1 Tax=Mangrovihabitans endophyticus TaxID=1751298 RepID=A0A8J3BY60_9ACTN|nr:LuxR C-terminal-related transcriptional regulator [Mangrovihabitans endophyticus]GGK91035.1 hypothetical protein GCM10012284_26110 [Mangrovihabitans endophyticus]